MHYTISLGFSILVRGNLKWQFLPCFRLDQSHRLIF